MMSSIKNIWGYIIAGIGLVTAILVYMFKQGKVNSLEAKIALSKTKEDIARVDEEIKKLEENKIKNDNKINELNNLKSKLELKKKEIAVKEGSKAPSEIENYWRDS